LFLLDLNSISSPEKSFLNLNLDILYKYKNNSYDCINSSKIYNSNGNKSLFISIKLILENFELKNQTYSQQHVNNTNESITIDLGSSTIITESKMKCLYNTNFTICININVNNNETCVPECYLNCQVHFMEELEQKFCLLNVCKCDIFEEIINMENSNINITNNNRTNIHESNFNLTFNINSKDSLGIYNNYKLVFLKYLIELQLNNGYEKYFLLIVLD